jgi:regulator of protease activity HflC (stomatin/prohibitin superfamily)
MFVLGKVKIRSFEKGLLFKDREFVGLLQTGRYWFFDPFGKIRVDVVSKRDPWLNHEALDVIVKSGALGNEATVLDLKDTQRALVWIDGRFDRVLLPGLYALWTGFRKVDVEIVDATTARLDRQDIKTILQWPGAREVMDVFTVEDGQTGVVFEDGTYTGTVGPGEYVYWKNAAKVKFYQVDVRETLMDVSGQEIMTSDKVTLRLNAIVGYRVTDAEKTVTEVGDAVQALYREAQLALRAIVGTRDLDTLLTEKDGVASELEAILRQRARPFGLAVITVGIRDVILPGDMKDLLNKVTEAKKAAEANLIARREETAAMRSQANTARLLDSNPTLMRLRELEVLESIAKSTKMSVVLGDKGLKDRVVNLI